MKPFCYDSPIGVLRINADATGVRSIQFTESNQNFASEDPPKKNAHAAQVVRELDEYFAGERQEFTCKLAPSGTPFQISVWTELLKIPFGSTATYKHIAERIGNSNAVRAVGGANNRNPIPIIIPCHRIIGTNQTLTGYAGGIAIKQKLLELEGIALPIG